MVLITLYASIPVLFFGCVVHSQNVWCGYSSSSAIHLAFLDLANMHFILFSLHVLILPTLVCVQTVKAGSSVPHKHLVPQDCILGTM